MCMRPCQDIRGSPLTNYIQIVEIRQGGSQPSKSLWRESEKFRVEKNDFNKNDFNKIAPEKNENIKSSAETLLYHKVFDLLKVSSKMRSQPVVFDLLSF